jgi:glutamate-1-semialdehyde 2,1-aminomutase
MTLSFEKSKELFQRASDVLAGGVSSGVRRTATPIPLYFERADGPYYYDVDGNELLDYTLAWGPLIVGSNHPRLNAVIIEQLGKSYTFGAQHELEIALASKMISILPGIDQVIFANSGTEAVQAALRIARAYTDRPKIIKFEGHYHGSGANIMVSVHPKESELGSPTHSYAGQLPQEYADTLVLPWNDLGALEHSFSLHPGKIACVITEPIMVNSGSCMPENGYLEGLIEICRKNGAVSIFDEVITGFRVALGGAREYFGLIPDLSVYAKALAGGFSMAAVAGRRDVFDVLREGRTIHFGTYNGSPINTAAAIATLEILSEPGVYKRLHEHGFAIKEALENAAKGHGFPLVTTGTGSVFSVHFGQTKSPRNYRDTLRTDTKKYRIFQEKMLHNQILLLPDGRWYVGLAHSKKELGKTTESIEKSFEEFIMQNSS